MWPVSRHGEVIFMSAHKRYDGWSDGRECGWAKTPEEVIDECGCMSSVASYMCVVYVCKKYVSVYTEREREMQKACFV